MITVTHYFDYKSPYAYLAQKANYGLASKDVSIEWVPYTLQIPKYLGAAELDENGNDIIQTRNDHQWRRVKYSYMDCRREANKQGLVIRGPRKIFDSSMVHIAFRFVLDQGDYLPFHNAIFERFWRREFDLENVNELTNLMTEFGLSATSFESYAKGEGRERYRRLQKDAEDRGIFGVPSWYVDGELYWGLERIDDVRKHLQTKIDNPSS